jgi:hypothetical protein
VLIAASTAGKNNYASSQDIPSPLRTFDLAQHGINILNHG